MQGTLATQYPDTMLVQCWNSVIDDGTTFNQHWVSASQKKAVTSAERKYILHLQVNKYGLLAALWQEETGRQLKSSKCLVYQILEIVEQILPSEFAQTEQIVTEVNDRRLCGKPA